MVLHQARLQIRLPMKLPSCLRMLRWEGPIVALLKTSENSGSFFLIVRFVFDPSINYHFCL